MTYHREEERETPGEQQQKINQSSADNQGFNDYTALKLRLDTTQILQKIEIYMRGYQEVVKIQRDGTPYYELEPVANPKANTNGVFNIMSFLQGVMSTSTVQGNIEDWNEYRNTIAYIRDDLSQAIMTNRINWGVKIYDFESLIDFIMVHIKMYLSRTVKNKERESYANTITHTESNTALQRDKPRWKMKVPGF